MLLDENTDGIGFPNSPSKPGRVRKSSLYSARDEIDHSKRLDDNVSVSRIVELRSAVNECEWRLLPSGIFSK